MNTIKMYIGTDWELFFFFFKQMPEDPSVIYTDQPMVIFGMCLWSKYQNN
jgi:hypothetical protein